jgi:hypothetical protein
VNFIVGKSWGMPEKNAYPRGTVVPMDVSYLTKLSMDVERVKDDFIRKISWLRPERNVSLKGTAVLTVSSNPK